MNTARFTVRAATGYDFGHLAPRDRGIIGSFESLTAAKVARDAHRALHADKNHGAAFEYAEIVDRDDEHAVIGYGHYGNGQRVIGVRPVLALAEGDDVLFRGSRRACEAFKA